SSNRFGTLTTQSSTVTRAISLDSSETLDSPNIWVALAPGNKRVCGLACLTGCVIPDYIRVDASRPDGRVAMQRTANPRTAVRFRFRPPGAAPAPTDALIPGSSVGRASGC